MRLSAARSTCRCLWNFSGLTSARKSVICTQLVHFQSSFAFVAVCFLTAAFCKPTDDVVCQRHSEVNVLATEPGIFDMLGQYSAGWAEQTSGMHYLRAILSITVAATCLKGLLALTAWHLSLPPPTWGQIRPTRMNLFLTLWGCGEQTTTWLISNVFSKYCWETIGELLELG